MASGNNDEPAVCDLQEATQTVDGELAIIIAQ